MSDQFEPAGPQTDPELQYPISTDGFHRADTPIPHYQLLKVDVFCGAATGRGMHAGHMYRVYITFFHSADPEGHYHFMEVGTGHSKEDAAREVTKWLTDPNWNQVGWRR